MKWLNTKDNPIVKFNDESKQTWINNKATPEGGFLIGVTTNSGLDVAHVYFNHNLCMYEVTTGDAYSAWDVPDISYWMEIQDPNKEEEQKSDGIISSIISESEKLTFIMHNILRLKPKSVKFLVKDLIQRTASCDCCRDTLTGKSIKIFCTKCYVEELIQSQDER